MAITKKFLKSKPVCKVTFALSETEAKTAEVVGDFNDWGATAFALKSKKTESSKELLIFLQISLLNFVTKLTANIAMMSKQMLISGMILLVTLMVYWNFNFYTITFFGTLEVFIPREVYRYAKSK